MILDINIDSKELKRILISTYKIAYSGNFRSNLFNVVITEKEFKISANNDIISIEKKTKNLEIIKPGKFVINAFIMNELCQKFDGNINIKMNGENIVHFNSGKSKNRVNTTDFKMFKDISFKFEGTKILLPKNTFKKIIKQVSFAVQGKDGRSTFQGINLRNYKKNLVASATDGSRIAKKILIKNFDKNIDLIVPVFFFNEVARLCDQDTEKNMIFSKDKILILIDNNTKILTKTFNDVFPNIELQLNQNIQTIIKCNCSEIIKAIERIDVINEKDEIPSVVFKVKDKKFLLSSTNDNQVGFSEEEIISAVIEGEEQNSILQVKYVINALKGFDKEKILIKFSDENGPIFLEMEDDKSVTNLILPFWNY